jgi:hypothetical protein
MKEKIVFGMTALICVTILMSAQLKKNAIKGPEDVILRILETAQKSDPGKFLTLFCDELQMNLQNQIYHMGENLFKQRMMENYKNLVGVAISNERKISEDMLYLTVEFVSEDNDDMKTYLFKKVKGDWKIKMIMDGNNA